MTEPVQFSLEELIELIERMMEIADPYEGQHGQRTADLAEAVARAVPFDDALLSLVRCAARVHDVGKIFLAEDILNKPGNLTDAEWHMVQLHTVLGTKAFRTTRFPAEVVEVVLYHHENYDGSGYPHHLKGDDIPALARLIRIVDTYDALRSKRAYRAGATVEQALQVMESHAEWFDPRIFETFKQLIQQEAE